MQKSAETTTGLQGNIVVIKKNQLNETVSKSFDEGMSRVIQTPNSIPEFLKLTKSGKTGHVTKRTTITCLKSYVKTTLKMFEPAIEKALTLQLNEIEENLRVISELNAAGNFNPHIWALGCYRDYLQYKKQIPIFEIYNVEKIAKNRKMEKLQLPKVLSTSIVKPKLEMRKKENRKQISIPVKKNTLYVALHLQCTQEETKKLLAYIKESNITIKTTDIRGNLANLF